MENGDILEFRLRSFWESTNDQFLNVFHYEAFGVSGDADLSEAGQDVIDDFATDVTSFFQDVISSEITFQGMDITNLSTPTEIFVGDFTSPFSGGVTGDVLPPFASWGFLYRRATATTRNGYKRFSGVPESLQVNGVATEAAIEDLNALAFALQSGFTASSPSDPLFSANFAPVIVRKDAAGALVLSNGITGINYRAIGTQNTRKFGRGM